MPKNPFFYFYLFSGIMFSFKSLIIIFTFMMRIHLSYFESSQNGAKTAPRRRCPPIAVLLWSFQVAPEYHREPVPRSRKTPGQDKAQSSAACIDGAAHVSSHDTLRDHGQCDRGYGSVGGGCGFDALGSGEDNRGELWFYCKDICSVDNGLTGDGCWDICLVLCSCWAWSWFEAGWFCGCWDGG